MFLLLFSVFNAVFSDFYCNGVAVALLMQWTRDSKAHYAICSLLLILLLQTNKTQQFNNFFLAMYEAE